jgi:tetratricopeptide (TPR) repeat protein
MVEPRRLDPLNDLDAPADREVRAEQLLVDGLDRYFENRYEDAIHVWTRVLFIDRSHARARAYIDRARTAIAERQRRVEELLHTGAELLDRGDTAAARDLLRDVVARGGDDERVAALRVRLERLEVLGRVRTRPVSSPRELPGVVRPSARRWPHAGRWGAALALLAAMSVLTVFLTGSLLPRWLNFRGPSPARADTVTASLPVLAADDVALIRARTAYGQGRLTDALRALDRIAARSPRSAEADRLRIEIQRLLLAARPAPPLGIAPR